MNLLEAIKSGKPFKRKSWATYIIYNPNWGSLQHYRTDGGIGTSVDLKGLDLVMDDYEFKNDVCMHEPIIHKSIDDILADLTGVKDVPDRGNSYKLSCKHCSVKIKAEKWVEA